MDYIDGTDIETYVSKNPEEINNIFSQAIKGFSYLEKNNILHRDIRPKNLMVTGENTLKIIDFGFGKRIVNNDDFEKSISLNWLYEKPLDFENHIYDFKTEVYFVGKLFESLISGGLIPRPLGRLKLGGRGICSLAYAKISRRNLQYPAALRRGFFIWRL
jgi:serine/threonine-protein kinase